MSAGARGWPGRKKNEGNIIGKERELGVSTFDSKPHLLISRGGPGDVQLVSAIATKWMPHQ